MISAGLDLSRVVQRDSVMACVSGGLDSCVMLALLANKFPKVYPIFVRNEHSWEETELLWLKRFIDAIDRPEVQPLIEIAMPLRKLLDEHWGEAGYQPDYDQGYAANFIPGRNVMLLSMVAMAAYVRKSHNIALGLLKGNPYPDAQPEFFQAFEAMSERGMDFSVRVIAPMLHLEKEEVIHLGKDLPLEYSFSCVKPQNSLHCGAFCNKCAERQKGFALAGIKDHTEYAHRPPDIDWHTHQWRD